MATPDYSGMAQVVITMRVKLAGSASPGVGVIHFFFVFFVFFFFFGFFFWCGCVREAGTGWPRRLAARFRSTPAGRRQRPAQRTSRAVPRRLAASSNRFEPSLPSTERSLDTTLTRLSLAAGPTRRRRPAAACCNPLGCPPHCRAQGVGLHNVRRGSRWGRPNLASATHRVPASQCFTGKGCSLMMVHHNLSLSESRRGHGPAGLASSRSRQMASRRAPGGGRAPASPRVGAYYVLQGPRSWLPAGPAAI